MPRLRTVAVLIATAATAACSAPAGPTGESTPTSAVPSVGHGSFAYCLSQHGVPAAPGPSSDPPAGVDADTWRVALAECSSLAPGPAG